MKIAQDEQHQCLGYTKHTHRRCRLQRRQGEKTCLIHKHYYTNWFTTHTADEWRTAGKRARQEIEFQLQHRHVVPPPHILADIPSHSLDVWNLFVTHSDESITLNRPCLEAALKYMIKSLFLLNHNGSELVRQTMQDNRKRLETYLKSPSDCQAVFRLVLQYCVRTCAFYFETMNVSSERIRAVFRSVVLKPQGWRQLLFSNGLEDVYQDERAKYIQMWPDTFNLLFMNKIDPIWRQVHSEFTEKHRTYLRERTAIIKEELIAEVFHPRRIEPLIMKYGIEVLDDF